MRLTIVLLLVAVALPAAAQPATLRIATVAPDGTSWARELHAWGRDVEAASQGELRIKIYFGGIAGSEEELLPRIRREQLDGAIGSEICTQLSPSLKVARVIGVFQSREENAFILSRLKSTLDQEFLRAGFINLGEAGLGPELLFTREPVADLNALRKLRLWVWSSDAVLPPQARALGLTVVQTPLEQAGRAFDEHQVDGFITIPTAALAFQWTTQVRYVTELRVSFRSGCLIVATHAFDALGLDAQRAIKSSVGKLNQRIEELGRREDAALLSGLLARQGMRVLPASELLRSQFFDIARTSRPGNRIVSQEIMQRVLSWLADYRAEHEATR